MPRRTRTELIGKKKVRDILADPKPKHDVPVAEKVAHFAAPFEPRLLNRWGW
ncbi:hypothetical protein ACWGCW_00815 [Streptomyces sp. NPDC054933]